MFRVCWTLFLVQIIILYRTTLSFYNLIQYYNILFCVIRRRLAAKLKALLPAIEDLDGGVERPADVIDGTPSHSACSESCWYKMARTPGLVSKSIRDELIRQAANKVDGKSGDSLLHVAASRWDVAAVRQLLNAGHFSFIIHQIRCHFKLNLSLPLPAMVV